MRIFTVLVCLFVVVLCAASSHAPRVRRGYGHFFEGMQNSDDTKTLKIVKRGYGHFKREVENKKEWGYGHYGR
jgi:hypothetical protein